MADDVFTNEIPRDNWGRPKIVQPNGKLVPYRRVTKFISVLDDTYNLELWMMRMVALGMGQRDDLVLAAASLTDQQADKQALNNVAKQAKEHAMASSKATKGTALHKLCERLDRGHEIGSVPAPFDQDLAAYVKTRDHYGLKFGHIETMRVFDPWKVAGTPDRTGCYKGKWYIIDIKTGDITWGEREIAMQLGLYAHSTPYTADLGRHDDIPAVDRKKAIVIHLPAGQAKCELHWIDIELGWAGCQVAKQVWDWRQHKGLLDGIPEPDAPPVYKNPLDTNAAKLSFAEAAMAATDPEGLRTLWREAASQMALTNDFKLAVKTRLAQLNGVA